MKKHLIKLSVAALWMSLYNTSSFAIIDSSGKLFKSQEDRPVKSIIVKFKQNHSLKTMSMQDVSSMVGNNVGLDLKTKKILSNGAYVLDVVNKDFSFFNKTSSIDYNKQLNKRLEQLSKRADIEYAELDDYMYIQKTPNDSRYAEQWHYFTEDAGIDLPSAWDITTGDKSIVVGVVDTGIVKHEDLDGKILPGFNIVDDDNEIDDPTDHGGETSYHGTHVAGTIGALTNNYGVVAGVSWGAQILPVRVLGDDGSGSMSNIIEGMRWAAGLSHDRNNNPAKIINMSLGGFGKCSDSLQEAINEITEAGTIIVVAAGNSDMHAKYFKPANCENVITVGASNNEGEKSFYSNFGSDVVDIVAPGGDKRDSKSGGILSLGAPGKFQFLQGTSMAAPHISGVVSLMLSIKPDLTVDQIKKYMQKSVKNDVMGVGLINTSRVLEMLKNGEEIEDNPVEDPVEDDYGDLDDIFDDIFSIYNIA